VVVLPLICLLGALALDAAKKPAARLGLLALALAACAGTDRNYFSRVKSHDKAIAGFLRQHDDSQTALLVYPAYRALSFARYYPPASRASEGLDVRSEADIPRRLIVLIEESRRLKPLQSALLGRYYRVEAEQTFGNTAAACLSRKDPPRGG
jgi:hypothetical protein